MGETWDGDWGEDELDSWVAGYESERRRATDTREVWLRSYDPFISQRRFHDSVARFKGFSGPVGSGKSLALAAEALRLAYLNPGLPGVVGAPTYPMLRDVTRAAFLELIEICGVPYKFKVNDNEVLLTEPRSLVRFRSMDKPTSLVGSNLAWFGVDELTYCKEDSWRRLEARLRHPKAKHLEGFAGWTPKGFDWVYGRFIGDSRVSGYDVILAQPGENRSLPPDYYDRLKASYDDKFYQQEVLGKYLSIFAGQVYYAFDRARNVSPVQFDPQRPICWTLDFNVNPAASVVGQLFGQFPHRTFNALQEIVLPNSNTLAACRVFRERIQAYLDILQGDRYGVVPLRVMVYGDPAGSQRKSSADLTDWKIVSDFLMADPSLEVSFHVDSSHPRIKARVNAMNGALLNADRVSRLTIHPSCKALTADLEQVSWRVDSSGGSTGELNSGAENKLTHVSDAVGYLVEKELGMRQVSGERSGYII